MDAAIFSPTATWAATFHLREFHFFFCIVSNVSVLKTLTLLVHAGLFWCFHNPPNCDIDYRIFNMRM